MQANEADLTCCTNGLTDALEDINRVQNAMATVTNIPAVVAKITGYLRGFCPPSHNRVALVLALPYPEFYRR